MSEENLYKPQNEQWIDPLEGILERAIAQMQQYHPEFELRRDLWWYMYTMDGVTDYVADDIVKALVWQHKNLKIHEYQMLVESSSEPDGVQLKSYREYNWDVEHIHGDKKHTGVASTAVSPNDGWNNRILNIVHDFDRAVQTLNLIDLRLELRSIIGTEQRWGLLYWEASVMGIKALGNTPAHAAIRAWGAYVGLWEANDDKAREFRGVQP